MTQPAVPSESAIRAALLDRIESYSRHVGVAPSGFCWAVMGDSTFYGKLKKGANFTVATYQRIFDYIDRHPDALHNQHKPKAKRKRNGGG